MIPVRPGSISTMFDTHPCQPSKLSPVTNVCTVTYIVAGRQYACVHSIVRHFVKNIMFATFCWRSKSTYIEGANTNHTILTDRASIRHLMCRWVGGIEALHFRGQRPRFWQHMGVTKGRKMAERHFESQRISSLLDCCFQLTDMLVGVWESCLVRSVGSCCFEAY